MSQQPEHLRSVQGTPGGGPVVRGAVVPAPDPATASSGPPDGLIAAMLADPVHAPERLALEAVARCGPEAAAWVAQLRSQRPDLTMGEQASLVRDRFVRLGRLSGAAGGALGLPGAVADLGVQAWNQARLVVYMAAVHGLDPTDRERAAEILYFTGVYKAISLAETAVEVASRRAPVRSILRHKTRSTAALAMALGRMLGRRTVKKLLTRAIPFGAIPLGAYSNDRAMAQLADRAVLTYAARLGHPWATDRAVPPQR